MEEQQQEYFKKKQEKEQIQIQVKLIRDQLHLKKTQMIQELRNLRQQYRVNNDYTDTSDHPSCIGSIHTHNQRSQRGDHNHSRSALDTFRTNPVKINKEIRERGGGSIQ
jgi:hypothetical protein